MSVKSFKFVSPGVFINEIDNSFIPKTAQTIGPVIIGRSTRGLAMQPTIVESYSDFVTMFGDTVAGNGGGDISREGNYQSPMYGTYAAKAFLRSNVAPLTYVRLLGQQTTIGSAAGGDAAAGWKTANRITTAVATNGGAYGLWLFDSGSAQNLGTGSLAATWYLNDGSLELSGAMAPNPHGLSDANARGVGKVIASDSDGLFTVVISGSQQEEKIKFSFDDSKETFIRKRFNTNPQLANTNAASFYPESSKKDYWLGETYEQAVRREGNATDTTLFGVILGIGNETTFGSGINSEYDPSNMKALASREAVAGWFIAQDQGTPSSYEPANTQKLFRLKGRGHGEWLHKNVKVSIDRIRQSTRTTDQYGTFSVVLRDINDTDNKIVVLERFDNLTLDPKSPNYIARKIGNQYTQWNSTTKTLDTYSDYPNASKFIYVEMNADVDAGATEASLLPFGYFGPPRPATITDISGTGSMAAGYSGLADYFVVGGASVIAGSRNGTSEDGETAFLSGTFAEALDIGDAGNALTGTLIFPTASLRVSASDGGMRDPTNAYWGFSSRRGQSASRPDASTSDFMNMLHANVGDDPTTGAYLVNGINAYGYIFSMDDVVNQSGYAYASGSRKTGDAVGSASYADLLDAGYNRFTAPFWGGFDGLDITVPDPLYNNGMSSTSTEDDSYVYHTYRRAIDTVADPEFLNMNLLAVPGLTVDALTEHMIDVCEERADAMALIDLSNVYIPSHEAYNASAADRIGTTARAAATDLKNRRIDSSYGATFYPWVQTRDESTGQLVWIPPTVAMMGVLASSQAKTDVWFAPAGFNRGGLSDGAAGIPITSVTQRLTSKDRDTLYESRINPIASFPNSGIVLFGQKTLQERQSALDRINVRRLVIFMKKQISILSTQILFEQNVQATWNRFKGLIEPFLANVKTRYGITDYRLILDESTTTPDLVDQNILYAKIMVKPARAIEFIAIDFVIASTGASFDD
jgi:hypothetical protein